MGNLCRTPQDDDTYIPIMKVLGLAVSDKPIFKVLISGTPFWLRDLIIQWTGTIWAILEESNPRMIIPVKFIKIGQAV